MSDDNPNEDFGNIPEDLDLSGGYVVDDDDWDNVAPAAEGGFDRRAWVKWNPKDTDKNPVTVRVRVCEPPYRVYKHNEMGRNPYYCTRYVFGHNAQGQFDRVDTGEPCDRCDEPDAKYPSLRGFAPVIVRDEAGDHAAQAEMSATILGGLLQFVKDPDWRKDYPHSRDLLRDVDLKVTMKPDGKGYDVVPARQPVKLTDKEKAMIADLDFDPKSFIERMLEKQGGNNE